jgi:glycosyltransferase involved in cell wall biosynthesis
VNVLILPGYRYPASLDEPLTCGDLRNTFNLSRALVRQGASVTVVSRRASGDPERASVEGVDVQRYRAELGRVFRTSFDVSLSRARLFRRAARSADVVVASSPLSLELLGRSRAPLVYVCSGLEDVLNYGGTAGESLQRVGLRLLRDPAKRRTWARSARVNTTAELEVGTLERLGVDRERIVAIGPGVEIERYQPVSADQIAAARRDLLPSAATDARVILSVSRFTPAKGLLETLEAFAALRAERSDVFLLLVGVQHSHRADHLELVRADIARRGLGEAVAIRENVPESRLPACFAAADVTSVFSIGYDPLPTVMIESMACGTPVVATDFPTRRQAISPGVDGLLVPERDGAGWRSAVRVLLDERETADRIRAAALRRVREQFDMNVVARRYLELFRTL